MRKREYLGQLELMVLLAVMRPARDAYGVLISRDIAEKSGREVALASVYAALERLEKEGVCQLLAGPADRGAGWQGADLLQSYRGRHPGSARSA